MRASPRGQRLERDAQIQPVIAGVLTDSDHGADDLLSAGQLDLADRQPERIQRASWSIADRTAGQGFHMRGPGHAGAARKDAGRLI